MTRGLTVGDLSGESGTVVYCLTDPEDHPTYSATRGDYWHAEPELPFACEACGGPMAEGRKVSTYQPVGQLDPLDILRGQVENFGWEHDGVSWGLNGSGADHAEVLYNFLSNLGMVPTDEPGDAS